MKVLLTGASGILGSAIISELQEAQIAYNGFNSTDLDISNWQDVKEKVNTINPTVIIHCAALTNVDLCEEDRNLAEKINVTSTAHLAQQAHNIRAKMIYISSCGVYGNGKTAPYTEHDATEPLNFHHQTKLEGEYQVQSICSDYLIIRTGWLFGGTIHHRKNFVEGRRKEAAMHPILKSATDKIGSPTYTVDVAKQILYLLRENATGIFNVVNEGCASRYNYVSAIIGFLRLPNTVEPVDSNMFPRRASMPDNECLENYNLNKAGFNQMRNWELALKEYISKNYNL